MTYVHRAVARGGSRPSAGSRGPLVQLALSVAAAGEAVSPGSLEERVRLSAHQESIRLLCVHDGRRVRLIASRHCLRVMGLPFSVRV